MTLRRLALILMLSLSLALRVRVRVRRPSSTRLFCSPNPNPNPNANPNSILDPNPDANDTGLVRVISRGRGWAVVEKPGGVPCHALPAWQLKTIKGPPPKPLLQRARDTLGARVNLVHRLDSGVSGCLLVTVPSEAEGNDAPSAGGAEGEGAPCAITRALQAAMATSEAAKVYYAVVRGEGETQRARGRFVEDRPIKGSEGTLRDAKTTFTWLCGCDAKDPDAAGPHLHPREVAARAVPGAWGRASLVKAELHTGRWHQIRRHLNGLNSPILGDTKHGASHTNREWRGYGLMAYGRLALHCAHLRLPATELTPEIDAICPLTPDLLTLVDALPFSADARRLAPELFDDD